MGAHDYEVRRGVEVRPALLLLGVSLSHRYSDLKWYRVVINCTVNDYEDDAIRGIHYSRNATTTHTIEY